MREWIPVIDKKSENLARTQLGYNLAMHTKYAIGLYGFDIRIQKYLKELAIESYYFPIKETILHNYSTYQLAL